MVCFLRKSARHARPKASTTRRSTVSHFLLVVYYVIYTYVQKVLFWPLCPPQFSTDFEASITARNKLVTYPVVSCLSAKIPPAPNHHAMPGVPKQPK